LKDAACSQARPRLSIFGDFYYQIGNIARFDNDRIAGASADALLKE
jgi:hypothetical protein